MNEPTMDEARIERGRRVLREQGRAEAVLILTAKQVLPSMRLMDWANLLDVPMSVVEDARHRARYRARYGRRPSDAGPALVKKKRRAETPGEFPCTEPGCGYVAQFLRGLRAHERASHGEQVPCPFCDRPCNPVGLGRHKSKCPENPALAGGGG